MSKHRRDVGNGEFDDEDELLRALRDLDDLESRYDDETYFRTCGRCGARTAPRWSESACLEEARRYGWRRVAESDRPGARRIDLCGTCAADAGVGPPLARWRW